MLNGRSQLDPMGEYTFCSSNGRSVADYIFVSSSLFEKMADFTVESRDESDHFPIS